MQVGSFSINTVSSLSADRQQVVRSAYAQSTNADQQSRVVERTALDSRKVEQVNATEKDAGKNVAKSPAQDEVDRALQQVNDAFSLQNQTLIATVERDKETGIDVFKVMDKLTKEVVLQLPPKAIVEMAKAMDEAAADKVQLISEKV
jgi:uncharacterized FlaG/YvyC family protein